MSCFIGPSLGRYIEHPATSGYQLKLNNPTLPSGYYWIKNSKMPNPLQMYVDMTTEGGGYDFYVITGGTVADRVFVDGSGGGTNSGIPLGLDIIYPRSSEHWQAMYNFVNGVLGQNINTFFATNIGAVYRNTTVGNGSGNYTTKIMRDPRYYGTGALDWRVPDGGRWWLRDTVYSEPNGDYANYGFLGNRGIPVPYVKGTSILTFNDLNNYTQNTGTTYLVSTNDKP